MARCAGRSLLAKSNYCFFSVIFRISSSIFFLSSSLSGFAVGRFSLQPAERDRTRITRASAQETVPRIDACLSFGRESWGEAEHNRREGQRHPALPFSNGLFLPVSDW